MAMLYEKRKITRLIESKFFHSSVLLIGFMLIVVELLYFFAPASFWGPVKFIDLVNVLAQVATAAAFFFGVYQFVRNKNIERQAALVTECRGLVAAMENTSNNYLESDGSYRSTFVFVDAIGSQSGNFNLIFRELEEDVHKAIVRMHWQNMFFGKFTHAMQMWDFANILEGLGVSGEDYLAALVKYRSREHQSQSIEMFAEYEKIKFVVDASIGASHKKIDDDNRLALFGLQVNVFESEEIENILHGTVNVIDSRVRAPIMLALNEKYNSNLIKAYRDIKNNRTKISPSKR